MKLFYNYVLKFMPYMLVAIAVSGCVKKMELDNIAKPHWTPGVAVPLINSTLSLKDIMNTQDSIQYLEEDANGFLTIYYRDSLFSVNASEFINIPSQDTTLKFGITDQDSLDLDMIGEVTVSTQDDYKLLFPLDAADDTLKIDTIQLRGGYFSYSFSVDFKNPVNIIFKVPSIRNAQGVALQDTFDFNYSQTGYVPIIQGNTIDVTGYTFDLSNAGTTTNTLKVEYTVQLIDSGYSITKEDSIIIDIDLSNIQFGFLNGYLGQHEFTFDPDTVDLTVYQSSLEGQFSLVDPKINIYLYNYFGMPVRVQFDALKAVKDGNELDIEYGTANPIIEFNQPDNIGDYATTVVELNNNTSNITDVIEMSPDYIIYDITGLSNHEGPNANTNFLSYDSKFNIELEVELPLWGTASGFVLMDTASLNLEESIDQLESLEFKLNIENGFPLDVGIQVYFADENYQYIDSLFFTDAQDPFYPLIASAMVGPDGLVTAPTLKTSYATLTNNAISNLENVKYVLIKGRLNTTNNGNTDVKVYSHYQIGVKMGLKAQLDVQP